MSGRVMSTLRPHGVLLAIGLVLFLAGAVTVGVKYRVYEVVSPSMQNVLRTGDRVVVDTAADGGSGLLRGDIVVLDPMAFPGQAEPGVLVKRVIGLGGDVVVCCDPNGRLTVNGRSIGEEYVGRDAPATEPFSVNVPPGRVFVLGDHRDVSVDSRLHLDEPEQGTVANSSVQARVVAITAPLNRLGEVPATPAFAAFGPPHPPQTGLFIAVCGLLAGLVFLIVAAIDWVRARRKRFRQGQGQGQGYG